MKNSNIVQANKNENLKHSSSRILMKMQAWIKQNTNKKHNLKLSSIHHHE